jgi:excisionase family DNA binding protein
MIGNARMENRWFSLAEIAAYLGVSKDSVYRWVEIGRMPAHKVGRQWKFKVEEVDAWVRSGKADTVAESPNVASARNRAGNRAARRDRE